MSTNQHLTQIKKYARALSSAATWHGSKSALGILSTSENSYLYEFYCYLRVVQDLMANNKVVYRQGGKKGKEHEWPKAAALKKNAPRFEVFTEKTGKKLFEVCGGTAVKGKHSIELNPDISFQVPDCGDKPTYEDLYLVVDAKFKKNSTDRLPLDEVNTFVSQVNLNLGLKGKRVKNLHFAEFEFLKKNTLLTNGNPHNDDDGLEKEAGIKQVYHFDIGKEYGVKG